MSTTSSTTLDIFQATMTGVGQYLAESAVYLLIFAFMLGMFTTILVILFSWKTR